MKTLIVDFSPVLYRWTFASTTYAENSLKLKKNENQVFDFNEYKDIFLFKVLTDVSNFKTRFEVDEVILAIDSKPYWRTDYWSGYKFGRKKNDNSGVDWASQRDASVEMIDILDKHSNIKIVKVEKTEGDDIGFVLSKELSKRGNEVIVKSLDHDWFYCTEYPNVKYWQTKHTAPTKKCGYVDFDSEELQKLKFEHRFFGDMSDYIRSVVAYTEFSPEFKKIYPNMTELKAWPKRHEIDISFGIKHAEDFPELAAKDKLSAYKHPRFGAKSFYKKQEKEGFTYQEFLDRNPIHQLNYDLNTLISMPETIPEDIRQSIIDAYDNLENNKNPGMLSEYFLSNNMFELIGRIGLL